MYDSVSCISDPNKIEVQATYNTNIGGDAGKDTYIVLESSKEKNSLTITKIDTLNKYMEGEFDVTFLLQRLPNGDKRFPDSIDTIRLSKVKFQSSLFSIKQ